MRGIDERRELGVGAEMRIDLREVGDPIAVIAGALMPRRALHGLVLEHRRDPDRGDAERLDIVEPLEKPLEVAAVIEPLGGRVVARRQPVAGQPTCIVGRVAIVEPVGQDEIDNLVLGQTRAHLFDRDCGRRTGEREQQRGGKAHAATGVGAAQWRAMKSAWLGIWATSRALSWSIVSRNSARSAAGIASASGWCPAGITPWPANT